MPSISIFYGITIYMYVNDHPQPHFHARYQGHETVYDFDGNQLRGTMPVKQDRLISAWAAIYKEDLEAD